MENFIFCAVRSVFKLVSCMFIVNMIKEKTHSFLMQLLDTFYPLKDSKSFLFSKFSQEASYSLRHFLGILFIFTFCWIFLYYFQDHILFFACLFVFVSFIHKQS